MATKFQEVQKGDILSETTYYQATGKNVNGTFGEGLNVVTDKGNTMTIHKGIVETNLVSASQYTEEKKVSLTELATILSNSNGKVFTVVYNKLPKKEDIVAAVNSLNKGKIISNSEMAAVVGKAYEGEERTLRGYLLTDEVLFGRLKVIDLDVKFASKEQEKANTQGNTLLLDSGVRLVDKRTLKSVIFDQVKYSLKK